MCGTLPAPSVANAAVFVPSCDITQSGRRCSMRDGAGLKARGGENCPIRLTEPRDGMCTIATREPPPGEERQEMGEMPGQHVPAGEPKRSAQHSSSPGASDR